MNNGKSVFDNFMGDVNDNGFAQPSNEMFTNPSADEAPEVNTDDGTVEPQEEKIPFHKDPKVQRFIEKEINKRLAGLEQKPEPKENDTSDYDSVVESFTEIIGNDTPEKVTALNGLKKALESLDEKAVRRAEARIQEIRQREKDEEVEAENELLEGFESIEETFNVDLTSPRAEKVRSEFASFIEKIAPKDKDGNIIAYPDMTSAWETFDSMKKTVPSKAKVIASRSMVRSKEVAHTTPDRRIDFNVVDEYLDSLKD